MIDLGRGGVHLSSEPGAGRTTLCLNMAREALENGSSVIWACMNAPDGSRFSEIMDGLDNNQIMEMRIIEFGSSLPLIEDLILDNIGQLGSGGLLVIDDWCEPIGRTRKEVSDSLTKIVKLSECGIIATSSAVGNASGSGPPLIARGERGLAGALRTVMLLRHPRRESYRILSDDGDEKLLEMGRSGLSLV
ncbi:MAG: hypothetical protein VX865_04050 [Candidatus Thermoplasmatota archaeon]|nr:hypothetical protein [Candidatus Thermoplasmatota archaeon]